MLIKNHSFIIICSCFLFLCQVGIGQDYELVGDAISIGSDCYQLTDAILNESGAIWNNTQIDLTQPFDIEYTINLGTDDAGADGIVFVFQNIGINALGAIAQGIGYQNINSSLGIEIDTWNNTNLSDLPEDHIAIISNGDSDHASVNNLAGPLFALPGGANMEDGQDYTIQIQWDPNTQSIEVYVNCILTISLLNYDLVNEIFAGNPDVWFGFTSATGGFYNAQTVCPSEDFEPCCLGNPGFIDP